MLNWHLILLLLVGFCDSQQNSSASNECANKKTSLKHVRTKRYLTFPDGSNFVLTVSSVKAFMTHVPSGWNSVIDIDVQFPLPDSKFSNKHYRRLFLHRQRRDVWDNLQTAFDYHNLNGRECIVRSICEAKKYLAPVGTSLIHDVLRAVFVPSASEELYDTYEELKDPNYCDKPQDCPFSFLQFILDFKQKKY